MNKYINRLILTLAILASCGSNARADFVLISVNTLHLGWDSATVPNYIWQKNSYLKASVFTPTFSTTLPMPPGLILLQEVMNSADPSSINGFLPTGYALAIAATKFNWNIKGLSSYKEAYAAIVKPAAVNVICSFSASNPINGVNFERPPDAYMVQGVASTSSTTPKPATWIVNFHAVFGSSSAVRKVEVAALKGLVTNLKSQVCGGVQTNRIVIAGDWNLSAKPVATVLKNNSIFSNPVVVPSGKTSINSTGTKASAYDHFAFDGSISPPIADTTNVPIFDPTSAPGNLTLAQYRQQISDHLGIAILIKD